MGNKFAFLDKIAWFVRGSDSSEASVQRRLLVPLVCVLTLLLSGFVLIMYQTQRSHLIRSNQELLEIAVVELDERVAEQSRAIHTITDSLTHSSELVRLLKDQDGNKLLAKYQALFNHLKADYGITHFYFHKPDGVNLIRIHNPQRNRDLITRHTMMESRRTKGPSAGIELGPLGTFTLRVVLPVFDGDTVVGYLELGKEIEDILEHIAHNHEFDITLIIKKDMLDREKWEAGMSMLGRSARWDQYKNEAVIYSSNDQMSSEIWGGIGHGDSSNDSLFHVHHGSSTNFVLVTSIEDVSGTKVGDLIAFSDVSESIAAFNRVLFLSTGSASGLLGTMILFLYIALRRIDRSIHEREASLRESESFQRTLFETSPDFIYVLDQDLIIRQVNRIHPECVTENVVGCSMLSFIPECDQKPLKDAFEHVVESGELQSIETGMISPDPDVRFALNRLSILPESGDSQSVMLIATDITDRKHDEQLLMESNALLVEQRECAQSANKAKSEFLANMSHEIRTPMTAILGYTGLLNDDDSLLLDPQRRKEMLRTVHENGKHLLTIINNILDISKIEAGKLEFESIAAQPTRVIADTLSLMKIPAKAKGLTLEVKYVGEMPETIHTDPTRLQQILMNIIGNAIKFTECGGIELVVKVVSWKSRPSIQFEIIDTGIGIASDQLDKVFLPFTQADNSVTRKFGGTGLGLHICKQLVEILGGFIEVESTYGKGSVFRFSVQTGSLDGVKMLSNPSHTAELVDKDSGHLVKGQKLDCSILLAEDGPDNQRLITFILKKAGAKMTVVENGKLALDAALEAQNAGRPFDLILMDMQMPVMDGYEATRQLRAKGYKLPVIALTAHAMVGDREKCISAGCDEFANKPIDRAALIQLIAQFTQKRSSAA